MNMGLGPQMSMPGQQAGVAPMGESLAEKTTEESKGNSFQAAGFNAGSINVAEFIPKGVVVNTKEQFPDLDAMDAKAPSKKKKKGGKPEPVKVAEAEPEFDESTPWKGRKSEFFVMAQASTQPAEEDPSNPMNLELNESQWNFIFMYYPEYAGSPYQMLSWLFTQTQQNEQIQAEIYAKPNTGEDDDRDDDKAAKKESKYDKGFGLPKTQNKK